MHESRFNRRRLLGALAASGAVSSIGQPALAKPPPNAEGTSFAFIEDFGAIGDGATDDTLAFERALAKLKPGAVLHLTPTRNYRLTRSLVFTKPLVVRGGTKEHTRLLFDDGAYAALGNQRAALIFPHSTSHQSPTSNAQRASLAGLSIAWIGRSRAQLHGLLIAAPIYLEQLDVIAFPGEGFRIEAETQTLKGNANGCSIFNCFAKDNESHGFAFYGNNANACILLGSRSFDNNGYGFYDSSLLGNTYIGSEADNNKKGGYASSNDLPNNSIYIGCYAEPNQYYNLNDRNMIIGPLGHANGISSGLLRSLPTGELFTNTGHIFSTDPDLATARGHTRYLSLRPEGVEIMHADGQRVRLTKLLSSNYVDLLNGNAPVIRLPIGPIAGNSSSARPLMPNGFTIGSSGVSGILGSGLHAPIAGTYARGALWLHEAPSTGGSIGWVCVTTGSPGEWREFGKIE